MPVWRNARQRRLYGKPDDPIDPGLGSNTRSTGASTPTSTESSTPLKTPPPPPPPKRVKREKTRPESAYDLVHGLPVTESEPDFSLLTNPIAPQSNQSVVAYAIHASRQNWLNGSMFETFWTRKPKGKKSLADGQINLREKMTKLHECSVTMGPHTFPVKIFTVRDDGVGIDDEADAKVEEILAAQRPAVDPLKSPSPVVDVKPENSPQISSPPTSSSQTNPTNIDQPIDAAPSEPTPTNPQEPPNVPAPNTTQLETETSEQSSLVSPPLLKRHTSSSEPISLKNSKRVRKTKQPEASKPSLEVEDSSDPRFASERERIAAQKRKNEELEQKLNNNKPCSDSSTGEIKREPFESATDLTAGPQSASPPDLVTENGDQTSSPSVTPSKESSIATVNGSDRNPPNSNSSNSNPPNTNPPNTNPPNPPNPAPPHPSGGPPPPENMAPPGPPNQLVVYRLQQMAARDPELSSLMRLVASGTADPGSISRFQDIINQVKASIAHMPLVVQPSPPMGGGAPLNSDPQLVRKTPISKPKLARYQTPYQPRPNARAVMLAIEFDENPTERYLLPKRSIIEYLESKEQVLWSFIHQQTLAEPGKTIKKLAKPVYTPITLIFNQINPRIAQTMERCVRKPEIVRYYMEETMRSAQRADPQYIWFQIEKNDEILADLIRKMPVPMMTPPPVPKKPLKPRKPRPPTAQQLQQQHFFEQQRQFQLYMMWLAKVKTGQPLPEPMLVTPRRAEPMILPPSYLVRPNGPLGLMRPVFNAPLAPPMPFPSPGMMANPDGNMPAPYQPNFSANPNANVQMAPPNPLWGHQNSSNFPNEVCNLPSPSFASSPQPGTMPVPTSQN